MRSVQDNYQSTHYLLAVHRIRKSADSYQTISIRTNLLPPTLQDVQHDYTTVSVIKDNGGKCDFFYTWRNHLSLSSNETGKNISHSCCWFQNCSEDIRSGNINGIRSTNGSHIVILFGKKLDNFNWKVTERSRKYDLLTNFEENTSLWIVKVKLCLCLTMTTDTEVNITATRILNTGITWRWAVSFKILPLYPREKGPRQTLDRRVAEYYSRSVRGGEEKNSCPCHSVNVSLKSRM